MKKKQRYIGFSLIEILLAVGTLSIGLLFIAATFLTGLYFSTIATERTTAAIATDEAFAKIMLYNINPTDLEADELKSFEELSTIDPNEFAYPSTDTDASQKQYYWSALCRRLDSSIASRLVQVTIFVSRKTGPNTRYLNPADPFNINISLPYPVPVKVSVSGNAGNYLLTIQEPTKINWINDGYTIIENTMGQIYRVVKRERDTPDKILLDRPWDPEDRYPDPDFVWVIPPPVGGGKNPNIAIYQKIVRF